MKKTTSIASLHNSYGSSLFLTRYKWVKNKTILPAKLSFTNAFVAISEKTKIFTPPNYQAV